MSEKEIEEIKTRIKKLPNVKEVIQELIENKFKGSFRDDNGVFTLNNCSEKTVREIVDYLINLSTLALAQLS